MIHAETLDPTITLLLRGYDDPAVTCIPEQFPKPPWNLTATVLWFPEHRAAEIMGLTRSQGRLTWADSLDIAEKLAEQYCVTDVFWTRPSGKREHKQRIGPRRWVTPGQTSSTPVAGGFPSPPHAARKTPAAGSFSFPSQVSLQSA